MADSNSTAAAAPAKPMPVVGGGDASGVSILLANHHSYGLAERCCYHFELMETLTSPFGRGPKNRGGRRRGLSISSQDDETSAEQTKNELLDHDSSNKSAHKCICGVVSLLECVSSAAEGKERRRRTKQAHREFNTRAQIVWRRNARGSGKRRAGVSSRMCHQPSRLPLPLSINTRVSFAYELTSIAVIVDASPSFVSLSEFKHELDLYGEWNGNASDPCCIPLDRLGPNLVSYFRGLVQPIELPPVAISGKGVTFGKWTPNMAVTVVAVYPPSDEGGRASAGVLVRDWRICDEVSALKLTAEVEKWARTKVEDTIAKRISTRDVAGINSHENLSTLDDFALPFEQSIGSWANVTSYMNDMLEVGDAALKTLPKEGRPLMLVCSDCKNVHCSAALGSFGETTRTDVPISVLDLSGLDGEVPVSTYLPMNVSDNSSSSMRDLCHSTGGIFINPITLEAAGVTKIGSTMDESSPLYSLQDHHYLGVAKKRSLRPNVLQWLTLFSLSPFSLASGQTPSSHQQQSTAKPSLNRYDSLSSMFSSIGGVGHQADGSLFDSISTQKSVDKPSVESDRVGITRYVLEPVRIKSLLMTRILEGYRAKKYGTTTNDNDKVSIIFTRRLAELGLTLHYEIYFVSSPSHSPFVGTASVQLLLSGDRELILLTKTMFKAEKSPHASARTSSAKRLSKFLRWTKKQDLLDSFLCTPGWAHTQNVEMDSDFVVRVQSMTRLQRYRHFRTEYLEVVTVTGNPFETSNSLFSDVMESNTAVDELFECLAMWSSHCVEPENRHTYMKIIESSEHDLIYYCILRCNPCPKASRLYEITVEFHGEIGTELRLAVRSSLVASLRACSHLIVLEKEISNLIQTRSVCHRRESRGTGVDATSMSPFLQHRFWRLTKDDDVLPLLTKRRVDIGKFFILSTSQEKMIFAKFAQNDGSECSETVIYQVLTTESDLFVDLHMEYSRGLFHQLRTDSPFYLKYQNVKRRDKDCGKNLIARRNLLKLIDGVSVSPLTEAGLCEDALRIVKCSSCSTSTRLKFFNRTSHLANEMLSRYIVDFIVSDHFKTPSAKLPTCYSLAGKQGLWFVMRVDWYVLSIAVLEDDDDSEGVQNEDQQFRRLSFFTAGIIDLYKSDGDFAEADSMTCDEENFGVCALVDSIQQAHARKYSLSCFHALQKGVLPAMSSIDLDFVEDPLTFHEVLDVLVELDDITPHMNENTPTITGTKLGLVIERLLGVVPGSNASLFFYKGRVSGHGEDGGLTTSEESDVSQAPIFFNFMLDSRLASMEDILALQKTVTVTALVSNFGASDVLSPGHLEAVERLERSLSAFASERILDQLRFKGRTLAKYDFELIQQNIQATHNLTLEVPCEFFVARAKALIAANNPSGSESDINYCFTVLLQMLRNSELTVVAREDAFLLLVDNEIGVLPYWCFAELDQSSGTIRLTVHHPLGRSHAQEILTKAEHLAKGIVKRTNQQLLLDAAHKSKSGSDLLLGDDAPFACPCQFTAEMPLNRRVLPQQAISQLEALPMVANFILSNHESVFIYKEVSESIFYMQLGYESDKESDQNPHQISLRVYGIDVPGHSIKIELVRMLRRKMMNLPLDALSAVLQKNSSFSLTSSDMQFVRGFAKQLKEIEGDPEPVLANVQHYYLPTVVQDPTVLFLMFRQNISGSTFIMKLHHELEEESENRGPLDEDFLFYFNSSPSKLDPSYQSSTTLTSRGRMFARQAGSGIAFIQVGVEGPCRQSTQPISLDAPLSHPDFTLAEKNNGHFRVKVEVINTTTDASVIHKWVALSLSQVLCAFAIERLIETARGLARSHAKILPGLISLRGMITFADNIPHPAVGSVRFNKRLRATVLANLSLEILNSAILDALCGRQQSNVNGVDILRREKRSSALVILSKEGGKVCAKMAINGKRIADKPTDCPEYFVVIGLNRDIKSFEEETARFRFFEAVSTSLVSAHDKESTFLRFASRMKGMNPSQFERRMGIILHVSRTSRELLTYNLNLQTRVQMETRMSEIERRYLSEELTGRASLHRRCLGSIASLFSDESKPERVKPLSTPTLADRSLDSKPVDRTKPTSTSMPQQQGTPIQTRRRIPRPTSMLRPTLIGKSVDGSALQAVQASRLRARSRPSIIQRSSSSGKPMKNPSPPSQRRETKSGAADPKKKSAGSLKSPTPAQPRRALIAYLNILKSSQTPLGRPWLDHAPLQNIVHKFLATEVKPVSIARLISMSCCNLVHSQSTSMRPHGDSIHAFMSFLQKQWKVHGLKTLAKDSDESSCLYLIKDITTSQSRRVSILIELAAGNDLVVHMKTFILFSRPLDASTNVVSLRHRENEVGIISAIVHDFIARMGHIEDQVFNFSCHRMARCAQGFSEALPEFGLRQLFESTLARFNEDYQSRRLLPFRLQRRFLDISSYLVLFDRSSLIDHLRQNLGLYNLRDCSRGAGVCLALRTVAVDFTVFVFIKTHVTVESAFDIFILCLTRSENINGYIVEEGFQRANQISAVILFSSMTKVSSMLDRASSNIRKMRVWKTFGLGFAGTGAGDVASMDYIQELRATSTSVDAINGGANEELNALLSDEGNDFHLNWHEVFASIRDRGADFFLHVIKCNQTDSGTVYIVYTRNDTFLDISFDAANRVEHAHVLLNAIDSGNKDGSPNASAEETSDEFLLFILQWLWKDTEKGFLGDNA